MWTSRTFRFAKQVVTFVLVSGFQFAQHNRGLCHFRRETFSSQLEPMVGGALARVSALRVDLGVGWAIIASPCRFLNFRF
jgi:hypothetical protein